MHLKSKDQKASRDPVANIMSEQLGHDPRLTKKTIPNFAPGCWRMTPGSGYLQSLRAPNVEVVAESVTKLMEDGIVDESGRNTKLMLSYLPQGLILPSCRISKSSAETGRILGSSSVTFPSAPGHHSSELSKSVPRVSGSRHTLAYAHVA